MQPSSSLVLSDVSADSEDVISPALVASRSAPLASGPPPNSKFPAPSSNAASKNNAKKQGHSAVTSGATVNGVATAGSSISAEAAKAQPPQIGTSRFGPQALAQSWASAGAPRQHSYAHATPSFDKAWGASFSCVSPGNPYNQSYSPQPPVVSANAVTTSGGPTAAAAAAAARGNEMLNPAGAAAAGPLQPSSSTGSAGLWVQKEWLESTLSSQRLDAMSLANTGTTRSCSSQGHVTPAPFPPSVAAAPGGGHHENGTPATTTVDGGAATATAASTAVANPQQGVVGHPAQAVDVGPPIYHMHSFGAYGQLDAMMSNMGHHLTGVPRAYSFANHGAHYFEPPGLQLGGGFSPPVASNANGHHIMAPPVSGEKGPEGHPEGANSAQQQTGYEDWYGSGYGAAGGYGGSWWDYSGGVKTDAYYYPTHGADAGHYYLAAGPPGPVEERAYYSVPLAAHGWNYIGPHDPVEGPPGVVPMSLGSHPSSRHAHAQMGPVAGPTLLTDMTNLDNMPTSWPAHASAPLPLASSSQKTIISLNDHINNGHSSSRLASNTNNGGGEKTNEKGLKKTQKTKNDAQWAPLSDYIRDILCFLEEKCRRQYEEWEQMGQDCVCIEYGLMAPDKLGQPRKEQADKKEPKSENDNDDGGVEEDNDDDPKDSNNKETGGKDDVKTAAEENKKNAKKKNNLKTKIRRLGEKKGLTLISKYENDPSLNRKRHCFRFQHCGILLATWKANFGSRTHDFVGVRPYKWTDFLSHFGFTHKGFFEFLEHQTLGAGRGEAILFESEVFGKELSVMYKPLLDVVVNDCVRAIPREKDSFLESANPYRLRRDFITGLRKLILDLPEKERTLTKIFDDEKVSKTSSSEQALLNKGPSDKSDRPAPGAAPPGGLLAKKESVDAACIKDFENSREQKGSTGETGNTTSRPGSSPSEKGNNNSKNKGNSSESSRVTAGSSTRVQGAFKRKYGASVHEVAQEIGFAIKKTSFRALVRMAGLSEKDVSDS